MNPLRSILIVFMTCFISTPALADYYQCVAGKVELITSVLTGDELAFMLELKTKPSVVSILLVKGPEVTSSPTSWVRGLSDARRICKALAKTSACAPTTGVANAVGIVVPIPVDDPDCDIDIEEATAEETTMDFSGEWSLEILSHSHDSCPPQAVASGIALAQVYTTQNRVSVTMPFTPEQLVSDVDFHEGWVETGENQWHAVVAETARGGIQSKTVYDMILVSEDHVQVDGTMTFDMDPALAKIAGMSPHCQFDIIFGADKLE